MEPATQPATPPVERRGFKKGWQWPVLIGAFLGLTATFDMFFLALASSHPALAAEEDYYERGQSWDHDQAEARESGLQLEVETSAVAGTAADQLVTVRVLDREGVPAADARVKVTAFHVAFPREPQAAALPGAGDGTYAAAMTMTRPGAWCLRLEVERGGLSQRDERTVYVTSRR